MGGIDERYLNVAHEIRGRLLERNWNEVVEVSRTMTTDFRTLDDVSAVALAFHRATMLSIGIESGSAFVRAQVGARLYGEAVF
jgi:hypothetical protein